VYDTISGGSDEVDLNGRKVNARAYCSWYNFKSADQQKKVGVLSGEGPAGHICMTSGPIAMRGDVLLSHADSVAS
jgi:hypothetical protein